MKIIVTLILKIYLQMFFDPFLAFSKKSKTRINFYVSCWSGNDKYFCVLFIASVALLQRHANSIDFYKRVFLRVVPMIISQFNKIFSK